MKSRSLDDDAFCRGLRPGDGLPWFINLAVTNRCNLSCPMCQSNRAAPLSVDIEKLEPFFHKLSHWLKPPRRILLTGGEPLTHKGIFTIVAMLSERGYHPMLNTNAAALTAEKAESLEKAGLSTINISLDGVGEVHDKMRLGPGLFQGVMDIIHYLSLHTSLEISVISVISAQNASSLPALTRLLASNPRIQKITFQAVTHPPALNWSADFYKEDPLWPCSKSQKQEIFSVIDELEKLKAQGAPIKNPAAQFAHWRKYFQNPLTFMQSNLCDVAQSSLTILADGSLVLCGAYEPLGTISDDPQKAWESQKAKDIRNEMKSCRTPCNYYVNCCYTSD